jgi:hypothetical protein
MSVHSMGMHVVAMYDVGVHDMGMHIVGVLGVGVHKTYNFSALKITFDAYLKVQYCPAKTKVSKLVSIDSYYSSVGALDILF